MTDDDRYLPAGFRDVDGGASAKLSGCLQFMQNLPCFQRYKRESLNCLQLKPGATAIDVGCGLGADAFTMAQVVGPSEFCGQTEVALSALPVRGTNPTIAWWQRLHRIRRPIRHP